MEDIRTKSIVRFSPHPKQLSALNTKATEVLYGGAAGGGKSHLMRLALILWCTEIPGLQAYLFRRHFRDLELNHLEGSKGFRAMLSNWTRSGLVQIVEGEIRFWNGSKIYLCHCQHEKDFSKYLGTEMHVLCIDEAVTFPEDLYRKLRSRVRATNLQLPQKYVGCFPRILLSSNPGGIGHHWVKRTFIDPHPPYECWQTPDEEGGMLRQFIPARLDDNPSMLQDDPSYRLRLRGLGSPDLVRAYELGDWNVIAGAFFSEFGQTHVIPQFRIPEHWTKFRSFDWGSYHPFSVGWWCVADGNAVIAYNGRALHFPRGSLIRYKEWYGSKEPGTNKGVKMTYHQVARGILDRSGKENYVYSVADPAIFKQDGGQSLAERFAEYGIFFERADNDRRSGWEEVRNRLVGIESPLIYFTENCVDAIRTLPALQHDEHDPTDVDTTNEDHAPDEIRYACKSRPLVSDKKDDESKPKFIQDYTYNDLITLDDSYSSSGNERV